MSNPCAATLAATKTPKSPFLKPSRVISLCFCGMSGVMAGVLSHSHILWQLLGFFLHFTKYDSAPLITTVHSATSPVTAVLWAQWHLIARCSRVIAVFCVFLPVRSTCSYVDFMCFVATLYTQQGQVAEKSNVWGLSSESFLYVTHKISSPWSGKPIANIWSTSPRITCLSLVRSSLPFCRWSLIRHFTMKTSHCQLCCDVTEVSAYLTFQLPCGARTGTWGAWPLFQSCSSPRSFSTKGTAKENVSAVPVCACAIKSFSL